ncbi:minor tail protein [Streptomyces phage Saftant]|uniref:Minor tail protein n=1 Tax=Streptomyces phage Saftant TaxID=2601693 RepID=A0A5J6D951_9CAUD|nr:minor tail protein [Streptomyces phage Saftant]QEQ94056.1 minor tail protein [Streptomyces phage Saftant]
MGASIYPPPIAGPESITSGLTAASGYSVNNFLATKFSGVCTVGFDLAIVTPYSTSDDPPHVGDHVIATIPDGYRPRRTMTGIYSTGYADGECDVTTAGTVTLRTTNGYPFSAGETVRFSVTYVL